MSRIADAAFGDRPYSESPGFKTGGTSREAARAVAPGARAGRERVFDAIAASGSGGMTADEAAALLGRRESYVRPRVTELFKAGRIVPTGGRRQNETGLPAKLWRAK